MESRVQKWGNSLAIRIPRTIARELCFDENTLVELHNDSGKLMISAKNSKYKLVDLLSKVSEENLHDEYDLGLPRGKELW